jgi:tetratricopeptide (TPR) repeat protein
MNREIAKLERKLLKGEKSERGGEIDLAQGALLASGVETVKELNRYLEKIDRLYRRIAEALLDLPPKGSDSKKARGIFNWLWQEKTHRYVYGGNFRLTRVLDAQLGGEEKVGNCLGLTVLYNALAQRFGLEVKVARLEDAFGLGPHLFTVLYAGERTVDIENIFPDGFDYRGHPGTEQREEWGDRELIADIYHSVGNDLFASGKLERSIGSYDRALILHPGYNRAHLNKGIALVELGRVEEAKEWFR